MDLWGPIVYEKHNCKIKHETVLEKKWKIWRKGHRIFVCWMPLKHPGTAAQICWLHAKGLASRMIHSFTDNKSLRHLPSFKRVHYHSICREETKHVSPWPLGSLSQALLDPAAPQRWQVQIGATGWIITCSCLVSAQPPDDPDIAEQTLQAPDVLPNPLSNQTDGAPAVDMGKGSGSPQSSRPGCWDHKAYLCSIWPRGSWLVGRGMSPMHKEPKVNRTEHFWQKVCLFPRRGI